MRQQSLEAKLQMQNLKSQHRKELQQLTMEHQTLIAQKDQELEKWMNSANAAAHDAQSARMGGGLAAQNYAYDDEDDNSAMGDSDYGSDHSDADEHLGKLMSLGDDMNVYEYEDDDWLEDESDSDYSEDMD